jgi:hypothetical protein
MKQCRTRGRRASSLQALLELTSCTQSQHVLSPGSSSWACESPKHNRCCVAYVLAAAGIATSNLVGSKTDSRFIAECPLLSTGSLLPGMPQAQLSVWTPAAMMASPLCWRYMMRMKYDQATKR